MVVLTLSFELYTTGQNQVRDGCSTTIAVGESLPQYCPQSAWYWFNGALATCVIPLNYDPAQYPYHPEIPRQRIGRPQPGLRPGPQACARRADVPRFCQPAPGRRQFPVP